MDSNSQSFTEVLSVLLQEELNKLLLSRCRAITRIVGDWHRAVDGANVEACQYSGKIGPPLSKYSGKRNSRLSFLET